MFDAPLADYEAYLMYLFAKEFGYRPRDYEALTLAERQTLMGFLRGSNLGWRHRRGDL